MVSNYEGSIFASVLPLARDHLGARQDQGLQADASKSIERTGQPYTKGYSGGLVWARSEQRGSTSPLHEFVLLPGTGVLTLRGGSRSACLVTTRWGVGGRVWKQGEGRRRGRRRGPGLWNC